MVVAAQGTADEQLTLSVDHREPASPRRIGGEQVTVAAGQLAAGVGNLVFALVCARLLDPSGFARLSVFLGLYLVLSLPATSLSAATAVDPARRDPMARRTAAASLALAAVLAVASPGLAPLLNLPIPMVVALAAALPATAPLAVDRGRLYGINRRRRVIASLVAEPSVRLSLGLVLAAGTGALGAALAVVLGSYAAREIARIRTTSKLHSRRGRIVVPNGTAGSSGTAGWTAVAFALLAVLQTQDLLFANVLLPPSRAGAYAALSTLGGAAAFATVTIPLVLLPRAARRERHSLAVAAGLAVLLALGAVTVVAVAPRTLSVALFGDRYGSIGKYAVLYMTAMGFIGVARVLVAHRCATGSGRSASFLTATAVLAQATSFGIWGRSVGSIAVSTLVASVLLFAGAVLELIAKSRQSLVTAHVLRAGHRAGDGAFTAVKAMPGRGLSRLRSAISNPTVRIVSVLSMVGLGVRCAVPRGIWLDEATSIHQASMPFGDMLKNLGSTDVHPPLYFSILWVTDRLIGSGPWAMRLPSILAGTLAIPAAYLAARDLWNKRSGVVAGALASVAPIMVWYSQEVRMYSMFMLLALLALWGQARVLRYGQRTGWWIYALASAALVWTEYFAVFQLVAQHAVFIAASARRPDRRRQLLIGLAASTFLIAVLIAPLAPFAWHQFVVNQTAGKGFGAPSQVGLAGAQTISVYTVLANLGWALVGYHSAAVMAGLVALWPMGILLALFLLGRNITDRTAAVLAAALVPALLLLAVGMFKRNLFDVRYMSGAVVAVLLLCARLVTGASRTIRVQAAACVVLVAVLAVSLGDEQVNGSNPRLYDFSGALNAVDARYRPGDLLLYTPDDLGLVISYYAPRVQAEGLGSHAPVRPHGTELFVLGSINLMGGAGPAQLGKVLSDLRRMDRQVAVIKKANVSVWVFKT